MKMMRVKANHIAFAMRDGRLEEFQKGMEVNFDRVLNPETGFTLGQAFEGREECFEPVGVPVSSLPSATLDDFINRNPAPSGEGE